MRKLEKACLAKLADLPIPDPFTIEALVSSMEIARGRSIRLLPMDDTVADLRTACGLRFSGHQTTYVLYRRRPTPFQTDHTLLHELAHEWLDHGTTLPMQEVLGGLSDGRLRAALEDLGEDVIVQGRTSYVDMEEREAEISASLIKSMVVRGRPAGNDLVSQLELSLSHPVAPPRRKLKP
ncbi:hypothetical protein [Streptomyces sp. NPDC002746]